MEEEWRMALMVLEHNLVCIPASLVVYCATLMGVD